jgi:hypothetical protein
MMGMMTADQVFSVANVAILPCWILLAVLPGRRWVTRGVVGTVATVMLAATYAAITLVVFPKAEGGFSSLADVALLLSNPWSLLAAWLHFFAFDLLVGAWEAEDSVERGVSRWLLVPCLFLTLMFGPIGWLAYRGVRLTKAANPSS